MKLGFYSSKNHSRLSDLNGRLRSATTASGFFRPRRDGQIPAQAQVAAWDAGVRVRAVFGPRFLYSGPKAKAEKKATARTLLGHTSRPLRASWPRRPRVGMGRIGRLHSFSFFFFPEAIIDAF